MPGRAVSGGVTPAAVGAGGAMSEPERPAAPWVLIVPHCRACGSSLQLLLSLTGYRVEMVRGGEAAVRRAREVRPRAALVDLDLPGEDGLEVGRRLRETLGGEVRLVG